MRAALALLAAAAVLLAASPALSAPEQVVAPYWRRGRSSWYGEPPATLRGPYRADGRAGRAHRAPPAQRPRTSGPPAPALN
jgi:hypothetical protein